MYWMDQFQRGRILSAVKFLAVVRWDQQRVKKEESNIQQ